MIDKQKEEEFYTKDFNFSYSSLNKLLFSPSLFYKDYILQDREIKTDKHLVEGKLIHCLLLEQEEFENKFALVPGKTPSDNIRKQSLKTDESRIAKVKVDDYDPYWKFLFNESKDVIDQDTYLRCQKQVDIIRSNKDVMNLFGDGKVHTGTDFELDGTKTYIEKYLKCDLKNYKFGLHGYIDYYKVDPDKKEIIICDLKTTGKTISDFAETVDFYNYWIQAAIYNYLVYKKLDAEDADNYKIFFKFVVIDKYNQVYVFDVLEGTMGKWAQGLSHILEQANYHYSERDYSLPYEFVINKPKL
jgi:hypothetical protein